MDQNWLKKKSWINKKSKKKLFLIVIGQKRFINGIDKFYHNSKKLIVINQSASKKKVNLKKKSNLITFVGKLNKAKGYDIFGNVIIKNFKQVSKLEIECLWWWTKRKTLL